MSNVLPLKRKQRWIFIRDPAMEDIIKTFRVDFISEWASHSPIWCEWETYCMGNEL